MAATFKQYEEVNFEIRFYNDRLKTLPVDPTTVGLTLEGPDGSLVTVTPSADGARPANLGKYKATYVFSVFGDWAFQWKTDTPRIVSSGTIKVTQSVVEDD